MKLHGETLQSMPVPESQRTRVVKVPSILSAAEIAEVHQLAEKVRVKTKLHKHDESRGWQVLFLQMEGLLQSCLPNIFEKLKVAVLETDKKHWDLIRQGTCNLRVAEFHSQHAPTEGLPDPHHYDQDSLVTIDVLLGSEFEGGSFRTLEADSSFTDHPFATGDALLFVSHKYHCVTPVLSGCRNVLVLEFWRGPERHCRHRCEAITGRCMLESHLREPCEVHEDRLGAETLSPDASEWNIFD
mmetsp:Transcript_34811/g.63406  ORF Transcript_34811/g.63406 Transcript_34811/m.63406 type:complete len:242 (-) Transcript_34811:159-884(-)